MGHKWEDIQNYTLGQFKVFCAAAARLKAREQAALVSSVYVGAQGTGKSVKETVAKIAKET